MKISAVFGFVVFCFLLNDAFAQNLSESEKRKQHLPYVRGATDCIANAVGRSSKFIEAVEIKNIAALIPDAMILCGDSLSSMIKMHDVIYNGGGMDFFKGPYIADIERAVRSRLATRISAAKIDIERLADQRREAAKKAAMERAEIEERENAARAAKIATAEKVLDLIRGRTMECIGKQALPMLVTDEKADVIAKAAMLFCESEVNALVGATYDAILATGAPSNEQNIRLSAKKRVEDVVTAHIVRAKAELLLNIQPNRDKEKVAPPAGSTF
jgi:hypothetical protein